MIEYEGGENDDDLLKSPCQRQICLPISPFNMVGWFRHILDFMILTFELYCLLSGWLVYPALLQKSFTPILSYPQSKVIRRRNVVIYEVTSYDLLLFYVHHPWIGPAPVYISAIRKPARCTHKFCYTLMDVVRSSSVIHLWTLCDHFSWYSNLLVYNIVLCTKYHYRHQLRLFHWHFYFV